VHSAGEDIVIGGANGLSLNGGTLDAVGNVVLDASSGVAQIDAIQISAGGEVLLNTAGYAAIQSGSTIAADTQFSVTAGGDIVIDDTTADAGNVLVFQSGGAFSTDDSDLTATDGIGITAADSLTLGGGSSAAAEVPGISTW